MRFPLKASAPLALVAALATVAPATAGASPAPPARAAGGDVVVLKYPTLVKTRVARGKRALKRGIQQVENGQAAKATTTLTTVRREMSAAWRGAKYIIRTTPPPPAEEARVRAHSSGGAPAGPTKAAPADTAFLVLDLHHTVAAAMIQLADGSGSVAMDAISTTLKAALDQRDQAIQDIVALAPPAPPADDARFHPTAHASGGAPVGATFDTVMPNAIIDLDDELQAIDGVKSDATDLTAGERRMLTSASNQIAKTRGTVNKTWPPVPTED